MKTITINVAGVTYEMFCGNYFVQSSQDPIYPYSKTFGLGTGTGWVIVRVGNNTGAPLKVIGKIDTIEKVNTGYRGNTIHQSALDQYQQDHSLPLETIISTGTTPIDYYFEKTTTVAQILTITCYAPLGTIQDATNNFFVEVRCPNPNISPP